MSVAYAPHLCDRCGMNTLRRSPARKRPWRHGICEPAETRPKIWADSPRPAVARPAKKAA